MGNVLQKGFLTYRLATRYNTGNTTNSVDNFTDAFSGFGSRKREVTR